jgi:hypothetical protein
VDRVETRAGVGFVGAPSLDRFKNVSTGDNYLCAVREDDRMLCWGGPRGL